MFGVQFHPEAILTQCGYELLANYLKLAGVAVEEFTERFSERDHPAGNAPETERNPYGGEKRLDYSKP